jgi:hypothetical protein
MPTFCRHNRLLQNCPICSREQAVELRELVSSSAPRSTGPSPRAGATKAGSKRGASNANRAVRVRQLARGADDGYHTRLVPGLRSSSDAERLAEELAFAAKRLTRLSEDPPGLYAEVARGDGELEERTWLAFLIAYMCPLDAPDPFESIRAARTTWASGEPPRIDENTKIGPRSAHTAQSGGATGDAYRAWAARAGSQRAAFTGEPSWSPERRFARVYERLALRGLHRDARFDLLVTLGALGVYELRADRLQLGGDNETTVAAKRALGIGDSLLLERRASELAGACGLPLEALDLGFYNWSCGERATLGLGEDTQPDPEALASARAALELA